MDATADDKQDDNVEEEDDVNFSSDEAVGIPWLKYTAPGFLKIPHRLGPQLGLSSRIWRNWFTYYDNGLYFV